MSTDTLVKSVEFGDTKIEIHSDHCSCNPWEEGFSLGCDLDLYGGDRFPDSESIKEYIAEQNRAGNPFVFNNIFVHPSYVTLSDRSALDVDIPPRKVRNYDIYILSMTALQYHERISGELIDQETLQERMEDVILNEYRLFRAWSDGHVYGYKIFRKCPTCDSWHEESLLSMWGFYCDNLSEINNLFSSAIEQVEDKKTAETLLEMLKKDGL